MTELAQGVGTQMSPQDQFCGAPRSVAPTICLVLEGDHVQAADEGFRSFLFELIARAPGVPVHLDMSRVTFIDSATLGTLISAYKGAVVAGGCVQITAASGQFEPCWRSPGPAASCSSAPSDRP